MTTLTATIGNTTTTPLASTSSYPLSTSISNTNLNASFSTSTINISNVHPLNEKEKKDKEKEEVEDDPIVQTYPVYITSELLSHLHVFQFLFHSKPFLFSSSSSSSSSSLNGPKPLDARIKPRSSFIELDFPFPSPSNCTSNHETYDSLKARQWAPSSSFSSSSSLASSNNQEQEHGVQVKGLEKLTWSSSKVPLKANYFIGVWYQDALHLTPIHSVLQFSPNFKHLDGVYQKEKEAKKKIEEEEKKLRGETSTTNPDRKLLSQLPRIETEEMLEARKKSITYWRKEREAESFVPLAYFHPEMPESKAVFSRLFATYSSPLSVTSSKSQYLNTMTPASLSKIEHLSDLQKKVGSFALEDLSHLDLPIRLYHLLMNARILPFDTMMYILNPSHPDELYHCLQSCAIPIRGVWILSSHLLHKETRLRFARDYLISLFHASKFQPPRIQRTQFITVAHLDLQDTTELLLELSIKKVIPLDSRLMQEVNLENEKKVLLHSRSHASLSHPAPNLATPQTTETYWELKYSTTKEPTVLETTVYSNFEQTALARAKKELGLISSSSSSSSSSTTTTSTTTPLDTSPSSFHSKLPFLPPPTLPSLTPTPPTTVPSSSSSSSLPLSLPTNLRPFLLDYFMHHGVVRKELCHRYFQSQYPQSCLNDFIPILNELCFCIHDAYVLQKRSDKNEVVRTAFLDLFKSSTSVKKNDILRAVKAKTGKDVPVKVFLDVLGELSHSTQSPYLWKGVDESHMV